MWPCWRAPWLALCLALSACAHAGSGPVASPAPDLRGWPKAVAWQAAGQEAAQVLAGYLRVETFNPPGNETRGARYLGEILQREGIPHEIVEFAPGRGSLIARLKGSGADKPLCLLSHIDVATADASLWPAGKGPASGTIDDQGFIWGRGALDMKGMGALELMTMVWLKRLKVPLRRDVVLLAVADEEVDNSGMKLVMERHWDRIGCSHMINEGGLGLRGVLFKDHTAWAISVAEKGVLWLKMTVRGKGGHGSTPMPQHTPARLLHHLQQLQRRKPVPRMHASLEEFLARVGRQRGGMSGFVMGRAALFRQLLTRMLMQKPGTRAALINTVNITGLDTGGNKPNVVPSTASARLDCRLLPGETAQDIIAELQRLVGHDPAVSFEVLHYEPAAGNTWDDPLFAALARHAVAGRDDAAAGPVLSIGFTDSIFARKKGVRAYGLVPFEVTQQEMETMHAPHERVSLTNVRRGLRILFNVVLESAADLARPGPHRAPLTPPRASAR